MDDRTAGLVLRALRRRRGWRQVDLAARAGCSQALVSIVERGHLDGVTVQTLRSLFAALDARVLIEPRWRGAELERLLDAQHALVVEHVADRLEAAGFRAMVEVTYSIAGERGSIDVLGVDAARRAALVCEVKTDLPAADAVGRKLDEKGRLAPVVVRERFGWSPAVVGVVLVMPESPRLRRLLGGPAASLARTFPVESRAVGTWLRNPSTPVAATWFVSAISVRNARRVQRPNFGRGARRPPGIVVLPSVDSADLEPPSRILR